MKTLKTILITLLFAGFTTMSNAVEFKAGVTVMGLSADAVGKEVSRVETTGSRTETAEAILGSVFAEIGVDLPFGGIALGVDIIPYDIADVAVTNVRSCGGAYACQTNTANVTVSDNMGGYLKLDLGDTGAYVKAMITEHTIEINENIMNKTTTDTQSASVYPDDEINGGHVSIGFEKDLDVIFVRAEVGMSEYEKAESISSTKNTTAQAQIKNGTHARISIGEAF